MKKQSLLKHKPLKQFKITFEMELTMGSGASACWHITQGTPVLSDVAIAAAHLT